MFKNIKVWLCCIILILSVGCASTNTDKKDSQINLVISKDYAKEILGREIITTKGDMSVIELLKANEKIETDKSGSYVTNINRINESMDKTKTSGSSWFFYVNGKSSNVGAKDYYPKAGDIIVMDYHKWSINEPFKDTITVDLSR